MKPIMKVGNRGWEAGVEDKIGFGGGQGEIAE